jgi:hypothetical protein
MFVASVIRIEPFICTLNFIFGLKILNSEKLLLQSQKILKGNAFYYFLKLKDLKNFNRGL